MMEYSGVTDILTHSTIDNTDILTQNLDAHVSIQWRHGYIDT